MNLNLERVRELIEELEQHRRLIDEALKSLTSLENAFNGNGKAHAATTAVATAAATSGDGNHKTEAAGFACVKHPHSREFSARGQCKLCQSEYMKEYWAKKRKTRVAAPIEAAETDDASEYVFSKQQRCPKCGLTTRFRRDRDADPSDYWVCLGGGCELKVANYRIAVDRDYVPSDDAMQRIS
ncbi:MAG TPA: hypothetical protein VKY31_03790 [Terriglobia bacterium]|nr:hypothetical protein [Terriglobia bacterium]